MNLEKQVCSLELSKKLKELGVKQESYFYWGFGPQGFEGGLILIQDTSYTEKYSAFSVAELGEMLPADFIHHEGRTLNKGWGFWYGDDEALYADTEADARAKILIYLIENKLNDPS